MLLQKIGFVPEAVAIISILSLIYTSYSSINTRNKTETNKFKGFHKLKNAFQLKHSSKKKSRINRIRFVAEMNDVQLKNYKNL